MILLAPWWPALVLDTACLASEPGRFSAGPPLSEGPGECCTSLVWPSLLLYESGVFDAYLSLHGEHVAGLMVSHLQYSSRHQYEVYWRSSHHFLSLSRRSSVSERVVLSFLERRLMQNTVASYCAALAELRWLALWVDTSSAPIS